MPKPIRFKNSASTTLNNGGNVNNSSNPVTFVVTSASLFPTDGNFLVKIDAEMLLVTAVSGTSFTASRAQEGTTIATHADGSDVKLFLTAGGLDLFAKDTNYFGTYANLPDITRAGQGYRATDTPFNFISDGSDWIPFYNEWQVSHANIGDFSSWVNQGSATWSDLGPSKSLATPPTFPDSLRIRLATAPGGNFTFTTLLKYNIPYTDGNENFGIGLINSGSSKIQTMLFILRSTPRDTENLEIINWTSPTVGSANPKQLPIHHENPIWFRIRRVTNDYFYEWSYNGRDWMLLYQTDTSGWCGTADGILFYIDTAGNTGSQNSTIDILHCVVN